MWKGTNKNTKRVTIDIMDEETKKMYYQVVNQLGYTAKLIVEEVVKRCLTQDQSQ